MKHWGRRKFLRLFGAATVAAAGTAMTPLAQGAVESVAYESPDHDEEFPRSNPKAA